MQEKTKDRVGLLFALRSQPFAAVWVGQTISALGDSAYMTALAWEVLILKNSATSMSIILLATQIPRLIFLLIGGVTSDRISKRLLMFLSDAGRALILLVIVVLGWQHLLQLWHLVILSIFFGVVSGFFLPAYRSVIPQLVENESLTSANALSALSRQLSTLIGPSLGALFITFVGPIGSFAFDGLTFVIAALSLFMVRLPSVITNQQSGVLFKSLEDTTRPDNAQKPHFFALIQEGFSYVIHSTWLWVTIVVGSLVNMVILGALQVAAPKLVYNIYGSGIWLYSTLITMFGLGAVIASVAMAQIKQLPHHGLAAYAALLAAGPLLILFGLPLPKPIEPIVAIGGITLLGFSLGAFNVIWVTLLQNMVPPDKIGRVSSIEQFGLYALTPLGYVLAGVLTDQIGANYFFMASGLLCLVVTCSALCITEIRKV